MPVYDINGTNIMTVYDKNGNPLTQAYDVNGSQLLDANDLAVMTYNVQRFRGINSQQAMQDQIINTYKPTIIGMQELGNSTLPSIGVNMLADYSVKRLSNHTNKIMMVTKSLTLNNLVIADFTNQDPLDLSMWNETRAYMKAEITVGDKIITWINTHLCFMTQSVKWLQMNEIFELAEQCDYCIITGDFNSQTVNATSDDYLNMYKQFVDAGYNLANNSPSSGFTNTFTNATTASALSDLTDAPDTIIVSSNITINSVTFDTTKFSYLNGQAIDHIPIYAELRIN